MNMQTIKLNNGVEMPQMGYGVFQVSPEECERCVSDALEVGYRMIDTAQAYQNEEGVGNAWKKSGIRREDFYPDHYIDLCAHFEVVPQVNQIETHVFCQQVESRKYMDELGIAHMSWGPLAEGKNGFFQNETLIAIGEKYGKTGPQVALRYLLQRGVIIIPKSSKKERMMQNLDLFDFTLSEEDMTAILQLDTAQPLIMPSHHSPEITKWFMSLLPRK